MSVIERISSHSFSAFGHVGRPGDGLVSSIRDGGVTLTKTSAQMRRDAEGLDFALDLYQVRPEGERLEAVRAERHPHSSQIFIPMAVDRYLVVVWPDHPDASEPRVFLAGPEDAVIYHPGTWHHGIVALGREAVFASAMWRTRGGVDVEFHTLARPLSIDLSGAAL